MNFSVFQLLFLYICILSLNLSYTYLCSIFPSCGMVSSWRSRTGLLSSLTLYLTHSSCSINTCWMNESTNKRTNNSKSCHKQDCPHHPIASLFHLDSDVFTLKNSVAEKTPAITPQCDAPILAFVVYCWEYKKQWAFWGTYLFWSQTEKSRWLCGQRFLNVAGLSHDWRCSEFPLFCGRPGQMWPDWSAFFEAQSNARKPLHAALVG